LYFELIPKGLDGVQDGWRRQGIFVLGVGVGLDGGT
jgi:hypothetical protein